METTIQKKPRQKTQAFQLKGSLFTLTVLQLIEPDVQLFEQQLEAQVQKAPKFFQYAPIVIDLQLLPTMYYNIDFNVLSDCLRKKQMIPVGIRGGSEEHHELAKQAGLATFAVSRHDESEEQSSKETSADKKTENKPAATSKKSSHNKSITVTKPVRSGQQIYARDGDLVVLAPVSQGAELLADGNIHIYGPLRGRALAGVSGDESARIFCSSLEAELISVAGHFSINETLTHNYQKQPHQVYLNEGKLRIQPL